VTVSARHPVAVRIELCGQVRLEVDGKRRERELPGRLGRVLLAYLALNRRRSVTRDELVEALWPFGPPDDPGRTLSTLLSALRRGLGPDFVRGRGELRLCLPDGARLDVECALAESARGRAALAAGDAPAAAACADAALEVLDRVLVAGFDAPWLEERRRDIDEERLGALELGAEAGLAAGGAGVQRALAAARRIVAEAPFRESGYALLMQAQAAQGNVAEALRSFERVRALMREELGTAPSDALRDAHQRLLERTEEQPAAPAGAELPLPGALARIARRRFVGRGDALELLRRRLAGAAAGERRFVLIAGEPGIGKTSIAAAFARAAHDGGATVLYGRSDDEALTPYQPVVEMLGHWVAHGGAGDLDDELDVDELGRLVPALRRRLRAPPGDPDDGDRYRLFEAVAAALSHAAGAGPLVLVCDDLQWADRPTLQLLRHLARGAAPERLLVVGTYRDVEVERESVLSELIGELRRDELLDRVPVGGLAAEEICALAELPPGAARRLREVTGGNPLFVGELLRARAEAGPGDFEVPEGIRDVLLRRVTRLGEPAHAVLTLAAVAGESFAVRTLELAGEAGGDAVLDVVERALAARLLTPSERPDVVGFAHALVRETLYGELGEAKRARLHLRVGEALEAQRGDPAQLAHHFFQARHVAGPDRAIHHAREAADRAAEALAWEDAAAQLERALEADRLREPPDPCDRTELLLALGEACLRGGHATARRAFAEAAEVARGRFPRQLARAAIGYGGRYYEAGVVDDELIALLREALEGLPDGESELRAVVLARLAEILHFAGDTDASIRLSERAVGLAGGLGDDQVLAAALAGRHVALLHVAHVEERLSVVARMLELARRAGDREREMQALQARIFDLLTVGDVPAAREDVARLDALARELRQPLFEHFVVAWSCTFAQLDGRLDEAERLALESFAMRQRLETQDAESVLAAQLFMIRRAQGRVEELLPAVTDAVQRYPALAAWRAALPLVHLAAGDEERARAELDRLVGGLSAVPEDFFWLTAAWLLAEASAAMRAAGPSEALYDRLAPFAGRFVQIGYAACDGPVARLLGLLAAARGDSALAAAHLEDALQASRIAGAAALEARARAELAELTAPGA
jgi:DNA-binding SARP family transcriptional activator